MEEKIYYILIGFASGIMVAYLYALITLDLKEVKLKLEEVNK